jgi:aconitate hydratase
MLYREEGVPLVVIAGKEYGTGSSRDWAAKGTRLLGVRAVLAESFERIHRSNLVGMGILPLQFLPGEGSESLGLTGSESFDIGMGQLAVGGTLEVQARGADGSARTFTARVRIDTPNELEYFQNGGILPYMLRQALKG